MTTRVAPLRHRAVSRMDSAERWIETGIVSGLHRHGDNSWFVPSFSSGPIVVTSCVDVSPTMSTKDAVGNGNAAMKEAAMQSLSTEAADSAESSARRTARAGARREPCTLNGHSSTKVGLEPGSIGREADVEAVRAGSTAGDRARTDPRVQ